MKRHIITTADGSKTIQIEDWNEQYHSIHGAIQESQHVFIKQGLSLVFDTIDTHSTSISVLEIGFGTGLNAFLTVLEAEKHTNHICYTGIEAYPISETEINALNYSELLDDQSSDEKFKALHDCSWEEKHTISPHLELTKRQMKFQDLADIDSYNLIYFDAFGARVQPELWTEDIFAIMFQALRPRGVLVTYCAKGSVRRAMQAVGFAVERLPGPPGKREMLRCTKHSATLSK